MGLELLARVRRTSMWVGVIAALLTATYAVPAHGLALALGTAWSLVNLVLLQRLIVALTGPDRRSIGATMRASVAIGGMLALFTAGWLLLLRFPAPLLMAGFAIPYVVLVLKAASLLVLPTHAWRRFTRTPWPAALVIVVLAAGAWAVASLGSAAPRAGHRVRAAAAQESGTTGGNGATSGAAEEHAGAGPAAQHGAGKGAHAASGEEAGPEKFANVITVLARAFPEASWAHFLHHYEVVIFSIFIALMLCVVAMIATRNPQMIPGPLQNVVEMVVDGLYNFIVDILGPRYGPRYVPFLGTLFVYILAMNLFGLIPFMDSPTSSLNVTVALALIVFVYSQYIGFRELGVLGWVDHMAGTPRSAIGWGLVPLMLPIHLMGELAKPISLACRLFGNIFGEDMLLVAFASLGITVLSFTHLPIGLPLQLPFLFLALLTSTLQALVFTVLSTIYFLLMLPHDDHGHEGEAQHAH
jgi:F-type H+-transporting ATPase subunit a